MEPIPRLKDLAEELGLSVATISLGLRHAGNISEKTCRRIEEAAARRKYKPNPHAAALSSGNRSKAKHGVPLAILRMPLVADGCLYPIDSFVDGIKARSEVLGYRSEVFTLKNPALLQKQLKILYSRGFLGVFLPPIGEAAHSVRSEWSPFSVLACGRYDQVSPFHTVRQELFESTRWALNEVFRRGYSRLGVALNMHSRPIVEDFERLAATSVCEMGRGGRISVLKTGLEEDPGGYLDWCKKGGFDAIAGFGVAHYYDLLKSGLRIPEDCGFIALHGERGRWGGKITSLIPQYRHAGCVAANRMDSMIRQRERGIPEAPEQISLKTHWQEGETLPPREK